MKMLKPLYKENPPLSVPPTSQCNAWGSCVCVCVGGGESKHFAMYFLNNAT